MDDEQQKQDEQTQDEGDGAAGPVSDSGLPPEGESSESSPPAAEASEESQPSEEGGDGGPSEEVAEEPVAEEVTSPEPDQEVEAVEEPAAEEPKAEEKKKDVIPGADLEPILVEPDKPELSAEEKARL